MKIKEVYDGYDVYIECEFENDVEREIFSVRDGNKLIVEVHEDKVLLKDIEDEEIEDMEEG